MRSVVVGAWVAAWLVACGGEQPPPQTENDAKEGTEAAPTKKGFGVQQELGELDEKKTTATFDQASSKLQACFAKGVARVPYLSGDVRFEVRIAESGSARWAFLSESTLGDRDTEECMLGVLRSASWPKPVGGEGVAKKGLSFDPGGDERPPVASTPDRLGGGFAKVKGELAGCRSSSGTAGMTVTMYIGTNGKPEAIGVSTADEKGEKAVPCVLGALRGATFSSPGSWAAKVTFQVD